MNTNNNKLFLMLFITIGMLWLNTIEAKGPPIRVEQAIPGEAEQGQTNLPVKIKGKGFQAGDTVHFVDPVTGDESQIQASIPVFDPGTGDLDTIINVNDSLDAVGNYDIEVRRSGGRGGKGTDLFRVNTKPDDPDSACTTSTTFPTFVFWDDKPSGGARLILSDEQGACLQELTFHPDYGYITAHDGLSMHYDANFDPGFGLGRVVFPDKLVGTRIHLVEFTVDASNTVTVLEDRTELAWMDPDNGVDGSIMDVDLSHDGQEFVFNYTTRIIGGMRSHSTHLANIDDCLAEQWRSADSTPCNGQSTEILATGPWVDSAEGEYYWSNIDFSHDDSKIFLEQFVHVYGYGGTYVLEKNGTGTWDLSHLYSGWHVSGPVLTDYDGSGEREIFMGSTEEAGDNPCGEIRILDAANCEAGDCTMVNPFTIAGNDASWLDDGRLIYQERSYHRRGKKGYRCETGQLKIIDPFNPNYTPIILGIPNSLVEARDPVGSR